MKDTTTKKEVKFFSVPEWEKEQDYLREMHKNGWRFVKVKHLGLYQFEKCEPEDYVYQLDYNQEGLEHKGEYIRMFRDCGWEYLQDFFGYSYFRKPVSEMNGKAEEIFCDDESRLDMMRRVFKGRLIPLILLFFGCILPNLIVQSQMQHTAGKVIFASYLGLVALYVILFAVFGYKFWKYYKNIKK